MALVALSLALMERARAPFFDNALTVAKPLGYLPIAAGSTRRYHLQLHAGEYARVVVDHLDIAVSLAATGPRLRLPAISGSEWGREALSIVATVPGDYQVEVIAESDDSAWGTYRISLKELRKATPSDELGVEAAFAFYRAQHASGESVASREEKDRLFQRSIRLWHRAGDERREAQALDCIGRFYHRTGRYTDAEPAFESSLALWNKLGDPFGRLETLKALGNLSGVFGKQAAGLPTLLEWLQMWRRLNDRRGEALILSTVSTYYRKAGDHFQAVVWEERAQRIREELGNLIAVADSLDALAIDQAQLLQLDQARASAERALQIIRDAGTQHQLAAALSRLADVLDASGQYEEAIKTYKESLHIRETEGDLSAQAEVNAALASIEKKRGNLAARLAYSEQSSELYERLSKAIKNPIKRDGFRGFFDHPGAYESSLLALHWRYPTAGYGSRAFLSTDCSRARYIVSSCTSDLASLRHLLDQNTALVEYWILDDHGAAWILTRAGLTIAPLKYSIEIPSLARKAYDLLSRRDSFHRAEYAPLMNRLSRLLLQPILPALKARRLLIVSDESFAFLPFAELPDPSRSDASPLIADHEIVYLTSAAAIAASRSQVSRDRPVRLLAVIADPVFDSGDSRFHHRSGVAAGPKAVNRDLAAATRSVGLARDNLGVPRLPFAGLEAQALATLAGPSQTTEFLGFRANRQTVLKNLNRYRILHFATHGIINADQPDLSGLVLSLLAPDGRAREGFLRLRDIYSLKLSADLVTLAACRTALGHRFTGNGVIGLTEGFRHAGAARVVSTAWSIDDEATEALMASFYRALLERRLSPAAALRQAQLTVAANKRWQSPYYWAGVFFYGDWGPMWIHPK